MPCLGARPPSGPVRGAYARDGSEDKPAEAEKVESEVLDVFDAPENEPSKNALVFDAPGHAVLRWALVVILVCNVGVLISSNITIAAEITVILRAHMSDVGTQKRATVHEPNRRGSCFRLAVRIRPGMVFLAFVAVLHMIFGALAAHNGNTAVAERMAAETDLPVKRRSSFEPEAAEEVKEDDKEDKKGFSMWESIPAQVKSVFPAEEAPQSISRQNSPLHVEA